jgi:hypothetical protein
MLPAELLRPQQALADSGLDEGLHKVLHSSGSFWLVLEHCQCFTWSSGPNTSTQTRARDDSNGYRSSTHLMCNA